MTLCASPLAAEPVLPPIIDMHLHAHSDAKARSPGDFRRLHADGKLMVFAEIGAPQNDRGFPRAHFYAQLKRLVDAGFGERILWGSDQMVWPDTIRVAIETIESADFLTREQKRDIFYNNAARFLRLGEREIARHHGMR